MTIFDAQVTPSSIILLHYINGSRGNELSIDSVRNGSFDVTGSPNKDFKYVVFNCS